MRVTSLRVYPIKSTRGLTVSESEVRRSGLEHDRRWAVVRPDGHRLTARTHPRLLSVVATVDPARGLRLEAPGRDPLAVPVPVDGAHLEVDFSRLDRVVDAGDAAAAWFTDLLGEPVRLAWLDDPGRRTINPDHGGLPDDPLSLADAGPLLLTTTASFDQLGAWLDEAGSPIAMLAERMRPNVIVDGADLDPFAEDDWRRVRIGDLDYRFADRCDRCVLTTIDPVSLDRGHEPIRTLAQHRRWRGKTWFGIWLVPLDSGRIRVGDEVTP